MKTKEEWFSGLRDMLSEVMNFHSMKFFNKSFKECTEEEVKFIIDQQVKNA